MQDLNDLALYAAVVRHHGFTAAAKALGIPKSRISKRIATLEQRLGVRLIERSTRKLNITDVGQAFYERCEAVLAGVEAAEAVVAVAKAEPTGTVRIAVPPGFAPAVADILPAFMKSHPQVRLSVIVTGRPVDLIEERIDIALRVREGYEMDQSLVVRRFGGTRRYLAASPQFLDRHGPVTFDAISRLPTLSMQENRSKPTWTLVNADGEARDIPHDPVLTCSDFTILERAAVAGIGLALLPDIIVERGFRAGLLSPVLPEWSSTEATVHAVFTSRHGMLPAVRALIDYLAKYLPRSMQRCQEMAVASLLSADWSI
ncbi:LysR family transcriptional regulator [Shinella daejeonensis]|uniref:LysR family transcriptional regulator n=1 Tax=Shinella daejeonensis TaxID=659017 RepID=UPI0020C80BCC|nr:LysR family transcriptional regulator [Shinella daejeonensis]MCP8895526.1 LysR family transcriptional regulator [Shinella daejeonensis]